MRVLAAPWLAPLAADPPCGPDPVAHEAFAELRAEVQKLSAIATTTVDWAMIEARSGELLQRHAKDLRLAAYFTLARHHRAGLTGLALGLTIAAELFDAHPAALHPRQPRARRLITEWLIAQVLTALHARRSPLPAGEFAALEAACDRLGAVLRERLGDDAPSQRPVREALQQLAPLEPETPADDASTSAADTTSPARSPSSPLSSPASPAAPSAFSSPLASPAATPPAASASPTNPAAGPASSAPAAPSPVSSPTAPAAPASATAGSSAGPANLSPAANAGTTTAPPIAPVVVQTATSVAAPADLAQIDRFLDATDDALVHAARSLREAQPADPRAYRLLRIGIWLRLASPPPTRPDGNTAISGLVERDRAALDELAARQRWLDLLHRSENLLRTHRLVLDLQRHSAAALTALGPDYASAALALRAELCGLLLRFASLPGLRDRDGRPLADPETQRWLSEHVLPRSRPAATTPAAEADVDPAFWSELPARLRGDDREAALAEAQTRIDQALPQGPLPAQPGPRGGRPRRRRPSPRRPPLHRPRRRRRAPAHRSVGPPLLARCLAGAARSHHRRGQPAARDQALEQLSRLDAPTTAALLTELP
ncbi:type VI secretion system protein TssA [Nannocystis pusilla]|uniref:Type VI secretion system protein TssA n=1 Tax=Nannocystis pusilla TaxID=889268 RepID=A0A9X3J2V3_9BACT|nr:type VI secretion system protein TssA [Nannocystis pusilla]MCY1013061.1 type VI secretion system protein TssA [Nannocystis pusilla]